MGNGTISWEIHKLADPVAQGTSNRTLVQAIQDLEHAPSRGFYFLEDAPDGAIGESYASFPELAPGITRRAGALQAARICKGDRLTIILLHTRELFISLLHAI